MGEARQKKAATFAQLRNGFCVLCGGTVAAQTVEHIPPRIFYIDKARPKGNEVSACSRCNHRSASADQIAALVCVSMKSSHRKDVPDTYFKKLLNGVRNNNPNVISYIGVGPAVPLRSSKYLILPNPNVAVKINPKLWTEYLNPWAAKQAIALYNIESGCVFPDTGIVFVNWFTNYQISLGKYPKEILEGLDHYRVLKNGKIETADQFHYNYFLIEDINAMVCMMGMQDSAIVFSMSFANESDVPSNHALWSLPSFRTNAIDGIVESSSSSRIRKTPATQ